MTTDYTGMWSELGLNLEAHQGLLAVLSDAYQNIYLSQKNRPEGMKYFDFVISEVHGLRIVELLKEKAKGRPIIGTFCLYVPEELILAVDGVAIGLCAGADVGSEEAEKYIPRNTCALIKGFIGFKLAGLCPYVESCDLIIGETTCDGKKKAYEVFDEITKKMYVMELPNKKGEDGRKLWQNEVKRLADKLSQVAGREITLDKLREAVAIVNAKRKALRRLSSLRSYDPAPISGLDALLINQVSFYDDPVRFTENLNTLCDELERRTASGVGVFPKGTPRILVSGSPMAIPNWKLHAIIEGSGAVAVGEEACVGERNFRDLMSEDFKSVDQALDDAASRSMSINCACFTPNDERLTDIKDMAANLHADGVIHYAIQFCTPYMIEAYKVKNAMEAEKIPFLKIETDYSLEDAGQLKTRVEAFVEMIRDGGKA
ncbi:MAG: R-phenyllactate dehydratase beta subunit [Syntrophorhabdaceae bacterium PtaU1.Bin034]|jgi:benzoyl-CoA reductase/2-hydroxyglutaryl-CoA dehydratase subunit BcrC/BadD/HgdB|nr:MAG: R-phenyllactate dehydratase beta subunit [Syntrophorhabdaceae bacterium PtaU1.Bin034]